MVVGVRKNMMLLFENKLSYIFCVVGAGVTNAEWAWWFIKLNQRCWLACLLCVIFYHVCFEIWISCGYVWLRCCRFGDKCVVLFLKRHSRTVLQHVMKAKRRSDIINKISNHSRNSPSFIFLRSNQIFRKYGNFKIWPWILMAKVTGKVSGQGHIRNESTNLFTLLLWHVNWAMHS